GVVEAGEDAAPPTDVVAVDEPSGVAERLEQPRWRVSDDRDAGAHRLDADHAPRLETARHEQHPRNAPHAPHIGLRWERREVTRPRGDLLAVTAAHTEE